MSNQKIELNEDIKITLDYTDILSIFSSTKMIKQFDAPFIDKMATEIEDLLEKKLKDSTE
ncbi:MAG: hypothetical protein L0H53_03545 [Candidatus Nitrosocosmicus sp.]|nr:hypothetical protein [Candidatus Nitrosocosmicus sp.]MDN5865946.1 hypothetical protein [Candidatus Nitrosocosmicus sp.]